MRSNPKFQFRLVWGTFLVSTLVVTAPAFAADHDWDDRSNVRQEKTLYVWASDQARVAPDFLTVINFDEDSDDYKVIERSRSRFLVIPTMSHHCHLSAAKTCWPAEDC
jgi:hypothetical protein